MKTIINFHRFRWGRLMMIGLILYSVLSLLAARAAAQDPTPVPTPTPAPTWTPAADATNTPVPNVPALPTPLPATVTPSNRVVDFRVDEDEIDSGDCVEFSWVVRGDVDRVEFDQLDDDKEAVLVSDQDEREECPEVDTDYRLVVKWLDGSKTSDTIEINVRDDGSSNGAGSSSGGSSTGQTTDSTVGVFIIVTPIALNSLTPEAESAADASSESDLFSQITQDASGGQSTEKPAGILGSVNALPETGGVSSRKLVSVEDRPSVSSEINYDLPTQRSEPFGLVAAAGRWGMLIVVAAVLVRLITSIRPNRSAGGSRD